MKKQPQDFDAADLYAQMTHNWRQKAARLQARRWAKLAGHDQADDQL